MKKAQFSGSQAIRAKRGMEHDYVHYWPAVVISTANSETLYNQALQKVQNSISGFLMGFQPMKE